MWDSSKVCFPLLTLVVPLIVLQHLVWETGAQQPEEDPSACTFNAISLGGLFSVHGHTDGASCDDEINEGPFANVEAMNEINRSPDILPNITLSYDIRDTCGLSNVALEQTVGLMDLKKDNGSAGIGISGVVGAALSDVSISVASLLRIFHIPQISHSSTAALLDDRQRFDFFFRTIPPDSLQARAMADLILHFNWSYVIALSTDDTYGRGGISSLISELERGNDTHVCVVTKPDVTNIPINADPSHYDRVIEFMMESWVMNSSVVVFFGQRQIAIDLLSVVANSSLPRDYFTWIASDAWATRVPSHLSSTVQGMLGLVPRVHRLESFVDHFESLNPYTAADPENPWLVEFWERRFNCKLSGPRDLQNCSEGEGLVLSNSTQNNGVTYVIDAVYAFAHAIENLLRESCPSSSAVCCNATVESFSKTVLNGTKLRDHLLRVQFTSPTSHNISFAVDYDQQDVYEIVNLREDELIQVGVWDTVNLLNISDDMVHWRGGESEVPESLCSLPCGLGEHPVLIPDQSDCCWTCEPCIGERTVSTGQECIECEIGMSPNPERNECIENPVAFLRWSDPWSVVILLFTVTGLAVTAFVATVFVVFNKEKIIKATSRELSAILLFGLALCYILPFFFVAPPTPATCALRRSGIGICFCLCFSPLLMKTNRIYRVFHQAPRTPRFAGPRSQVVFTCCLILVQVVIAIVWLVCERPSAVTIEGKETNERRCGENPYVGLPLSLIYNIFLLVLATFYAFLARDIPAKFNEGRVIAVTLYTICIIWIAFFPTYLATARFGSVYQTVSLVFSVLLSASTTLACLFIPKVVLVFRQIVKERTDRKNKSNNVERYSVDTKSTDADITLDYALQMQESTSTE